ncbi:Secreted RxLR effector peptide protein [Phytophthora palmivora]|uniref:Secreted RxLR effector peptide protein n=1 Tax=Phytophthora palmivora TaxID=4796 RepID=A0A2P4Y4E3_9STRA|nr:Secreted RxLR effector peptide protein [Phytophthora palmivora]
MRTNFVLLLAVITVLTTNAVLGATFKLRPSEDVIELTRTGDADLNGKRVLLEEAKSPNQVDEERLALPEVLKKIGTSYKTWSANRKFKGDLKKIVGQTTDYESGAQTLMKKGVDPDVFHTTFRLHNIKNKYKTLNPWKDNYATPTHEFKLWQSLKTAWEHAHPTKTWKHNG